MARESSMADRREYVRVSVSLPMNPKLGLIDDPAVSWLYVVSLCHCGEYLTDGVFIGSIVARKAGVPGELGKRLVSAGMWHEEGHECPRCPQPPEGQMVIHDYLMHQRSRAQADQVRTAGQTAAHARWSKRDANRMRTASEPQCDPDATPNAEVEGEGEGEKTSPPGGAAAAASARKSSAARRSAPAPGGQEEINAGHLVAEWIEGCRTRPPGKVVGQMSRQIRVLLEEGFAPEVIREAIAEWMTKDVHPSVLDSIVNSIVNGRPGGLTNSNGRRHQSEGYHNGIALARRLHEEEEAGDASTNGQLAMEGPGQ